MNQSDNNDDRLAKFRNEFHIPQHAGADEIYFVGNSLGLMPKRAADFIQTEIDNWKTLGVRAHFEGDNPWMPYHETLAPAMANIVGAQPAEVVMMNGLTVNLHLMMASFFNPTKRKKKILIEQHAFPSDIYAAKSRLRLSGFDETRDLIVMPPDQGELFSTDYICETIKTNADSLAMVLLPGVQYYTGQRFDIAQITAVAHEHDVIALFDLAHAAGNVKIDLHDSNVDCAVWCTYKYLNSGPGAVAGCFVHQRHAENVDLPRMAGWWGQDKTNRFEMGGDFQPIPTAEGWQLSNPPIMAMAPVRASLELFEEAGGMTPLLEKSQRLTGHLEQLLAERLEGKIKIITPADPDQRGCQLSLEVAPEFDGKAIYHQLELTGVRTDWRQPNVIRAAPVPLYNSLDDVDQFVDRLSQVLDGQ